MTRALAALLATSGPAQSAAPRLIMVSGGPLTEPILLSDAEQVFELYGSFFEGPSVDRALLEGRPSLRLGLFWDNTLWEPYVRGGRLDELRPGQANQVGRFFPAVNGEPALVDVPGYGTWPKAANDVALRILERVAIPTRLDGDGTMPVPWIAAGLIGGAVVAAAVVLLVLRSWRDAASQARSGA